MWVCGLSRKAIHARVVGLVLWLLLLLRWRLRRRGGILASQRRRALTGSGHNGGLPVLGAYAAVRTQAAVVGSSVGRRGACGGSDSSGGEGGGDGGGDSGGGKLARVWVVDVY